MLDDFLEENPVNTASLEQKPSYQNNNGYQGNKSQGGQNAGWKRKPDTLQDPYMPIAVYVPRDATQEVKTSLYNIISKLINAGFTVRVNADDKDFFAKVQSLSDTKIEAFLPWRGFNDIQSKHTFNTITANHIAEKNFSGWEKVPKPVQGFLARNVRMLFGDNNNSIVLGLITWSPDGASAIAELTKDSGNAAFIIRVACRFKFNVVNIAKSSSGNVLERMFTT